MGVFPDEMRGPEASDLLLIVQPATAGSVEFCAELKEAVGSVFHKSKVSLTGGLLRALTEEADAVFPKTYDVLASVLLEEIRATDGNEKLHQLLHNVSERLAAPYKERVEGKAKAERVRETARIMEEQGCLVDVTEASGEFYIDEYTCPFPKTAERDRAVCALHVDFVRILSGDDARLTRSLLRGERACTYRIRPSAKRSIPSTTVS